MMSDSEVVEAVKNGDNARYAELVERYQKMVYGIAWSRLGDAALCEDAAQETFIKAFKSLLSLRNPEKFAMWIAQITRNVSTSLLRTRKREIEKCTRWQMVFRAEPAILSPGEELSEEEPYIGQTLTQILSDLPEQHRECLVLFYLEGKNIREAAERLGISETAMKTRLHRARIALRGRMEEALESSLSGLGPRPHFTAGLMPLLPSLPLATTGMGGLSAAAKGLLWGMKSLACIPFNFVMLFPVAFPLFLHRWFGKMEINNLAKSPGRELRKNIIRSNVLFLVLSLLIILFISIHIQRQFLLQFFALFFLWGTYSAARMLRVNRLPFTIGTVLSNIIFLVMSILMGFFHAPFWTFAAALLVLNLILYHTNKTKPNRHDYNLFMRQRIGLFGTLVPITERLIPTQEQMLAFMRFLGERYLIRDYSLNKNGLALFLTPIKQGLEQCFSYNSSNSSVHIDYDGLVEAHLGMKDYRSLQALTVGEELQKQVIEFEVAEVVENAFQLFLAGKRFQAEAVLQAESNEEIFLKPTAKSREHRIRGILAIVAALYLLIFGIWVHSDMSRKYISSQRVSRELAQDTFGKWCREYPASREEFINLMNGECIPPLTFLRPEDRASYKSILTQLMTKRDDGDLTLRVVNNLSSPMCLYHVIENKILTMDELEALGFSSKKIREVLNDGGKDKLAQMDQQTITGIGFDGRMYTMPDITIHAYRLACLKAFECLDFIDSEHIAKVIASKQITRDWKRPEGYEKVDTKKAAGLFHFGYCDLRSTYGALKALQVLNRLDRVDQAACIDAIVRLHSNQGHFQAFLFKGGIHISGNEDDTFYAMESLAILNGYDRINDLMRWKFNPITTTRTQGGIVSSGPVSLSKQTELVTSYAIKSWSYQLRLDNIRATVIANRANRAVNNPR